MLHSLARALVAISLLIPVNSFGLGLGEIELSSALNQPFDAKIGLSATELIDPQDIKVNMASGEDFQKAGIEPLTFLGDIQFEVVAATPGQSPFIRLTSTQPAKEPFLDFIVEVNWPKGRLLREYTVLLDPPVFIDEAPSPVSSPVLEKEEENFASPMDQPEPVPAEPNAADQDLHSATTTVDSLGAIEYGPVAVTDTLWKIAQRVKPDNSVSVNQVMMALLKNNPQAFYAKNINGLKAGYVLRIDDPALISEMSHSEAVREAIRQNEQWLDGRQLLARSASKSPLGVQSDSSASADVVSTGETSATEAKLKLLTTDGGATGSASGDAFGEAKNEIDRIRQELALALESSEVSRQENVELRERLASLEEQLSAMQRLITLKDDSLAAMQGRVAEQTEPAEAIDSQEIGGIEADPADVSVDNESNQNQPVAPPPMVPPVSQSDDSLLTGLMMDPMLLVVVVSVVVLLGGLLWLIRRRQLAAAGFDEGLHAAEAETEVEEATSSLSNLDKIEQFASDSAVENIQADVDEMDTLAEADVYLAYRRFDKAEELLKQAIDNEPQRLDLQLKLIEVYGASKNVGEFVTRAESYFADAGQETPADWDVVVELGRQLAPEHPLFGHADGSQSDNSEADDLAVHTDIESRLDEANDDEVNELSDLTSHSDDKLMADFSGDTREALDESDSINEFSSRAFGSESSELEVAEELDTRDDSSEFLQSADDDTPEVNEGAETDGYTTEMGDGFGEAESEDTLSALDASASDEQDPGHGDTNEAEKNESLVIDQEENEPAEDNIIEFESGLAPSGISDNDNDEDNETDNVMSFDLDVLPESESPEGDDDSVDIELPPENNNSIIELDDTVLADKEGLNGEDDSKSGQDAMAEANVEDLDWMSNVGSELEGDEQSLDDLLGSFGDDDDESLFASEDEIGTKLDLAKAYIDMGDQDSARSILIEVEQDGNDNQKQEAHELKQQLG
ncbi:MAG: FimV/HubP family polar landmark protein [Gammaproteobacteria bacterium]